MYRQIYQPHPTAALAASQGEPAPWSATKATNMFTQSNHIVGYCTEFSIALLARLSQKHSRPLAYGFIYVSAPNRPPVFMNSTPFQAIKAAVESNKRRSRVMLISNKLDEFLEAARSYQKNWPPPATEEDKADIDLSEKQWLPMHVWIVYYKDEDGMEKTWSVSAASENHARFLWGEHCPGDEIVKVLLVREGAAAETWEVYYTTLSGAPGVWRGPAQSEHHASQLCKRQHPNVLVQGSALLCPQRS